MVQRVLVPLDGSLPAEGILPYAVAIARQSVARIELLRVIDEAGTQASADEYISRIAQTCRAVGRVLVAGNPISTILDELKAVEGTLLALTTHGRSGVTEELFGSVALSLVRNAGQPVLLYRPGQPGAPLHDVSIATVIAPLDGSEFAERILPHAIQLAKALSTELQVVQVIPSSVGEAWRPGDVQESSYVHARARLAMQEGVRAGWEVLHGDPARAIAAFVGGRTDVILAMTSHARAGLSKTIFGSVMSACLRTAGVPVYVLGPSD
jgi:nucleotide-binding universal stress UspA family protein